MKPEPGGATGCGMPSQLCRADHRAVSGNMGRGPVLLPVSLATGSPIVT